MPCRGPTEAEFTSRTRLTNEASEILWIGRICAQKRPERFLEVAEACPDLRFNFVGPVSEEERDYAEKILERARAVPNVTVHGPVSRDRVSEFMKRASCMLCTPDYEGFPNTYLEAWSFGVPVISTFDPDNLIAKFALGRVGRTVNELISGIRDLLNSAENYRVASENARRYYLQNHAEELVIATWEALFLDALRS